MALSPYNVADQSSFSRLALVSALSRFQKTSSVLSARSSGSGTPVSINQSLARDSFEVPSSSKSSSKAGNLGNMKSGKGGLRDPGGFGG